MDLPVDLFGCSIFNKMALWLLNSPIIVVEIRRQTKRTIFLHHQETKLNNGRMIKRSFRNRDWPVGSMV